MGRRSKQGKHLNKARSAKGNKPLTEEQNENFDEMFSTGESEMFSTESSDTTTKFDNSGHSKKEKPGTFSKSCVFSTLNAGGSYRQMNRFCVQMDYDYVSKTAFFRNQKEIKKEIIDYAKESMKNARESLNPGSVICVDGRYPTRRNSSHCSVDLIDTKSG